MVLSRRDSWIINWTQGHRYEPIPPEAGGRWRMFGCTSSSTTTGCCRRSRAQKHAYYYNGNVKTRSRGTITSRVVTASLLGGAILCGVGFWAAVTKLPPHHHADADTIADLRGTEGTRGPSTLEKMVAIGQEGNQQSSPWSAKADEPFQQRHPLGEDDSSVGDGPMQVRLSNKYQFGSNSGSPDWLYPWEHIAEPYRDTFMEVVAWPTPDGIPENERNFRWEVEGTVVGVGTSITHVFKATGIYQCTVTGLDARNNSSGNLLRQQFSEAASSTLSFAVTVKYVRREIRDMTDRDREILFNAISIVQRVPSAVGQQIYGRKYYSRDFFNRMHLYMGGDPACDHWHDAAGFVTAHVGIELMFEQVLQSIDPSISLPYWDFTIEGTFYNASTFRSSSVFSDDWFGDASPQNALRVVNRGRFAFVPTMMNASEYSLITNAYGLLHAKWNTNPTPFVTRSDHVAGFFNNRKPSGCRQYRDSIKAESWMALAAGIGKDAHGHIHELLGGSWSPEADEYAAYRAADIVAPFLHTMQGQSRLLWRAKYFTCPESCSIDTPWYACTCQCDASAMAGMSPAEVLEDAGVLSAGFFYDRNMSLIYRLEDDEGHALDPIPGYTKSQTDEIFQEMLNVLCMPMMTGTHYTGTSTNDVTFWLLHPTFDRVWHLSRLEASPDFDHTWEETDACYGHNPTDIHPLWGMFPEDRHEGRNVVGSNDITPIKKYYTNEELYDKLSPDGMDIPYLYDNLDWSHCEAIGVHVRSRGNTHT